MPRVTRPPQILAVSGVLDPEVGYRPDGALRRHAVGLAGVSGRPTKVCFVPTAAGDDHRHVERFLAGGVIPGEDLDRSVLTLFDRPNVPDVRGHLVGQDVIWCGGGSVVNQLAVWRAHRLDEVLWDCWQSGVVLAGQSAGSLCWHTGGVSDSFGDKLDVVTDLLGWLPFSNGVHDDLAAAYGLPGCRRVRGHRAWVRHRGRRRTALHGHRTHRGRCRHRGQHGLVRRTRWQRRLPGDQGRTATAPPW